MLSVIAECTGLHAEEIPSLPNQLETRHSFIRFEAEIIFVMPPGGASWHGKLPCHGVP